MTGNLGGEPSYEAKKRQQQQEQQKRNPKLKDVRAKIFQSIEYF